MLALSLGVGRRNPRGVRVACDATAEDFAAALAAQPSGVESWWSPHIWRGDHRGTDQWEGASGIALDLDYRDEAGVHTAPSPAIAERLRGAWMAGLPGNIFHATPRGARVAFLFPAIVRDREQYAAAARAAAAQITAALLAAGITGYAIDTGCLLDLARLLYSPRSIVKGRQRETDLLVSEAPLAIPQVVAQPLKLAPAIGIAEAVARYNASHAREWPRSNGTCPICGHKECFGQLPSAPERWACFSDAHVGAGIVGVKCHHGDPLDVDAHAAGKTRIEMLRHEGVLAAAMPEAEADAKPRPGVLTKSYASLVDIVRHRGADIVGGALEYSEMLCSPTIDGVAVRDADTGRVREKIELMIRDDKNNGLRFASADIQQAIEQVAAEAPYNPVREYLEHLSWDGVSRIGLLAAEILHADTDPLTQSVLRKWFISAVARAMRPGCKVDTVLILQGAQGAGKSSFFRTLAGDDWFSDSPIDIENKDALLLLRRCWLLEWSELDAMSRARDQGAVKAFITSSVDTFRPPYGRATIDAKRHCVIVGSTNDQEILSDPSGSRRYWIVPVGRVDLRLLAAWRDQLWAEALSAFRAGERWYLDREEDDALQERQRGFERRDPWEDDVLRFASAAVREITTAKILDGALNKPAGQWTTGDARRVAAIMRGAGYVSRRAGRDQRRVWTR